MVPAPLQSIYHQYKADTDAVAKWLATAATAHGYYGHAKSKKPNGKSKKQKAGAKKDAPPTSFGASLTDPNPAPRAAPSAAPKRFVLSLKSFRDIATLLAGLEDTSGSDILKVPDYFAVAIERAIWVRKTFSQRLKDAGASVHAGKDRSHSHFVGVLEHVRDCLKPFIDAGVYNSDELNKLNDAAAAGAGKKADPNPFRNMFGILGVYEPSEAFLNAPDVVRAPVTSDIEYVAEESDDFDDAFFAFTALLSDYDRLRTEIQALWADWVDQDLDLASVAVATNAAFELARSMEEEIEPLIRKHGGRGAMVKKCFDTLCATLGFEVKRPFVEAYAIAQTTLFGPMCILTSYHGKWSRAPFSCYTGADQYDEELGCGETDEQNWRQDSAALAGLLPDLHFLSSPFGKGPVEDELIRGFSAYLKSESSFPPLWLAWAIRIYLDILEDLGPDCVWGFGEMEQENLRAKKAMLGVPTTFPGRAEVLRVATAWDVDPIVKFRRDLHALGRLSPAHPSRPDVPFDFLRRNPLYCGLWVHHVRYLLHYQGVMYAGPSAAIMSTVQLYHALHQEKLLTEDDPKWGDLETFREIQGDSTFFVGEPPTDLEGYHRNYCLSIGLSLANWAPSRQKQQQQQPLQQTKKNKNKKRKGKKNDENDDDDDHYVLINLKNRRSLQNTGYVSLEFRNRAQPVEKADERAPLSMDQLQSILEKGRRAALLDHKGHLRADRKEAQAEAAEASDLLNPSTAKTRPTDVIRALAEAIEDEIPAIRYDIFAIHNTCWAFLLRLKEAFHATIVDDVSLRGDEDKDDLPFLAGYALSIAAGHTTGLHTTVDEETGGNPILLYTAAEVMLSFLEEEGGRNGHAIRDAALQDVVSWEEIAEAGDLDFDPTTVEHPVWGTDRTEREIRRTVERRLAENGSSRRPEVDQGTDLEAVLEQCRVQ